MAEQQTSTSYTLPPEYIQQFLAGGGEGSGVAGLFPLLNQSMMNQFATLGQPGMTPFTYQGERIAGFSPRELAAFGLADQAIGSYIPYLNRQTALNEAGLSTGLSGLTDQRNQALMGRDVALGGLADAAALNRQGTTETLSGLDEAGRRLRGLEGIQDRGFNQAQNLYGRAAGSVLGGADRGGLYSRLGTGRTLAGLGDATSTARGAYGLLGSQLGGADLTARGTLQDAARTSLGATRGFDPSSVSRFMNPYEDQVVQQVLRDVREQGSVADQRQRANAIASGAFGGSRSRLQASELAEAQRLAELDAVAQLRRGGYGEAMGQAANAFENQQRRQAGAAGQLGNIAGGLGSLAGQQATAGQNLANQLANYGMSGGTALGNLGATLSNLGQIRGGALSGLGSAIQGMTGERVGLGSQLASGIGSLGAARGAAVSGLGNTLGNLGRLAGGDFNRYGSTLGQTGTMAGGLQQATGNQMGAIGNNLGNLQRQDISLLGSVGGANRNMNQAINDLTYQNFVGQYNLPQNLLGQYSGIAQGIAPLAGATGYNMTSAPNVDYFSSALGGFTNALGQTFMNPFNNPGGGSAGAGSNVSGGGFYGPM